MNRPAHNSEAEQERRKQDAELYLDTRKGYNAAHAKAEEGYDKWLLTLSGGALGLSMTFFKEFSELQHGVVGHGDFLLAAWILFAASIACTLSNMRICPHLQEKFRIILDHQFSPEKYDPNINNMALVTKEQAKMKLLPRLMTAFNWTSLLCFLVGIVLLALFTSRNFR